MTTTRFRILWRGRTSRARSNKDAALSMPEDGEGKLCINRTRDWLRMSTNLPDEGWESSSSAIKLSYSGKELDCGGLLAFSGPAAMYACKVVLSFLQEPGGAKTRQAQNHAYSKARGKKALVNFLSS